MRQRYYRASGIAVSLVLIGAVAAPATAGQQQRLRASGGLTAAAANQLSDDIDHVLASTNLDGADVGVVVRDSSGAVVYSRNGDKRFAPASNNKLLTSAAAIDRLGLDYTFPTTVTAVGGREGDALRGDLYLKGTGDPTITADGYDALAKQVADSGIKLVTGALYADDTWFDDVRLGLDWAWDDEPAFYAQQISALTVAADADLNTGVVQVKVAPQDIAGKPAVVTMNPANDYVRIINKAVTGPGTVTINRVHGTNDVVVTGKIAVGAAPATKLVTFNEPELLAASLFRASLRKYGVVVTEPVTERAATPAGSAIATVQSQPLREFLPEFLKLSNNGHAEILLKSLGRKFSNNGSAIEGAKAVAAFLTANGVDTRTVRTVDGSGLSRLDLITPEQITKLLTAVKGKPWFATWYAALPIAGETDRMVAGTLLNRMNGTAAAKNVHAKTGSMTAVSALSGYVTSKAVEQLTFSILTNDHMAAAADIKAIENSIAVLLANSGGPAAAAQKDLAKVRSEKQLVRDDPRTPVDESALECTWARAC